MIYCSDSVSATPAGQSRDPASRKSRGQDGHEHEYEDDDEGVVIEIVDADGTVG